MPVLASDVIFKVVTLFLVFMGVLAMFGKLRLPGGKRRLSRDVCPRCGRHTFGKPCDCKGRRA